jgi:hypothetical protein
MDRSEYLSAVNEYFYQGEVLGEAFGASYVRLEGDPDRRHKWASLMQLETETKALLRPFLIRLGLGVEQSDVSEQIAGFAKLYHAKTWRQHMDELSDITAFYLGKFREIEMAAPEDERSTARYMIAHETAIHDFARAELAGDARGSLAGLVGQLRWPLPAPTSL